MKINMNDQRFMIILIAWKWLSQHPKFYYFEHRRIIGYMKRNQHEEFVTRIHLKHAHILIVGMLLFNGIWHIGSLLANRFRLKSSPTFIIFVLVNDKIIPMVLILSKHAQMIYCVYRQENEAFSKGNAQSFILFYVLQYIKQGS